MGIKRICAAAIAVIALAGVAGYLLVRSWRDTPYGRLDPRVALFLKLTDAGSKNPRSLSMTVPESRRHLEEMASLVGGAPMEMASVKDAVASAGGLSVPVRIYAPVEGGPLPAVLFYHGGGFVEGSLDTHDPLCRILAHKTRALVVAVDYRLAPEHTFPAAINDAYAALLWVHKEGGTIHADPRRIAVAGDSAGGNLAAAVCLMARDRKGPAIAFQALIYPGLDSKNLNTESFGIFAEGYLLTRKGMEKYIGLYLPDAKDRTSPLASPLLAPNHRGLPPALVLTAEFDVLRDEGEAYAKRLNDAGVPARAMRFPGMIHGFVSADRLLPQAGEAVDEIAAALRGALATR